MVIRPIHPLAFVKQMREALQMTGPSALIVFRDRHGEEHPVSKVKIRRLDTIIICEREDVDG